MEDKKDRCSIKINKTLKNIWVNLRRIQFTERLSKLITDLRLSENCKSKEYNVFKAMIADAGQSAINIDCKALMELSPALFLTKRDYCKKHYVDEIEMMVRLVSLNNKRFWSSLKNCVYHHMGFNFKDEHILGKNEI